MTTREYIEATLMDLATTAQYLRESARLMREAALHLVETEERLVSNNRVMMRTVERVENAITNALKAFDTTEPDKESDG